MGIHPTLKSEANWIIQKLNDHGYSAYFVGGYVRDRILNREISDVDIATNATPLEIMNIFDRTVPTGIQHGTVLVLAEYNQFEVTTYRTESEYKDYRRPVEVTFVEELLDDLARRDFTINALAEDLNGAIVDPFHGQTDLKNKRIKCVGNANVRFQEDALRMVRAVRFSAQLGFNIDPDTWHALVNQKSLLTHIAMERVGQELLKIMKSDYPVAGLLLLVESELLTHTKLTLNIDSAFWMKQLTNINLDLAQLESEKERWAALFIALAYSSNDALSFLKKLKTPSEFQKGILSILNFHATMAFGKLNRDSFIIETIRTSKEAAEAYIRITQAPIDVQEWLSQIKAYSLNELAINGTDLIQYGFNAGPLVGKCLHQLLEQVALGHLSNDKQSLFEWLMTLHKEPKHGQSSDH